MIFGWWIFPELGIEGAAWATVVAHISGTLLVGLLLYKRKFKFRLIKELSLLKGYVQIMKIGLPIAALGAGFSIIYVFLTPIMTAYGDAPLAAVAIGHRIEGLSYFMAVGLATAVATLVGQNVGARKFDRAKKAVHLSILYVNIILVVFSLIFFFASKQIYSIFSDTADVIEIGSSYLMIMAIFQIFMGWEIIFNQAFAGAGNSNPAFVISFSLSLIRIPLAILFAQYFDWGSDGIWWAISISTFLKGIVLALWWRRGKWKSKALKIASEVTSRIPETPEFAISVESERS